MYSNVGEFTNVLVTKLIQPEAQQWQYLKLLLHTTQAQASTINCYFIFSEGKINIDIESK